MANISTTDLDFDISESMLDPFNGTLQFTVRSKIRITNFEFSTHDMGCGRTSERDVKYGLKLTLNGKILFTYHKTRVDVEVGKKLILTPGNTYKLETWVGGHKAVKPGQIVKSCHYHYAQIAPSDTTNYEPFDYVFADDEDQPSNRTCVYVISYASVDWCNLSQLTVFC